MLNKSEFFVKTFAIKSEKHIELKKVKLRKHTKIKPPSYQSGLCSFDSVRSNNQYNTCFYPCEVRDELSTGHMFLSCRG